MSESKDHGWEFLFSDNKGNEGSGSYYGADGSWATWNSDGSGSYYGADGSWGSRNSDGSINTDDEKEDADSYSSSDTLSGAEILGALFGFGLAARQANIIEAEVILREQQRKDQIKREKAIERRAKRAAFCKKHWKAILVLCLIIIGLGFGYYEYNELQKRIEIRVSSSELVGKDHDTARIILERNGFINIREDAIPDLEALETSKSGIVSDVSVKGKSEFDATSKFPYDAKVVITYHTIKLIVVPMSAKAAKKLDYAKLMDSFRDAGFYKVRAVPQYDVGLGLFNKDGAVESVSINGNTDFSETATYRPDADVVITYHTLKKNKPE